MKALLGMSYGQLAFFGLGLSVFVSLFPPNSPGQCLQSWHEVVLLLARSWAAHLSWLSESEMVASTNPISEIHSDSENESHS